MDYTIGMLLEGMLADVSTYLLLVVVVLLAIRKNRWLNLSALGLVLHFMPFFLAHLAIPLFFKEGGSLTEDEFLMEVTNGIAALGVFLTAFGFYKRVSEFQDAKNRDR